MSDLPRFQVPDSVVFARNPSVSELSDTTIVDIPHKKFEITAPEIILDVLWSQLYESGGVALMNKKTRHVAEVWVSPLADAENFRLAVMAYLFVSYLRMGEIKEYQEERASEAIATFFNLPFQMAQAVAEQMTAQQEG